MSHDSHSMATVAAAIQSLVNSPEIPLQPDGYRIITEGGTELYGWADARRDAPPIPSPEG